MTQDAVLARTVVAAASSLEVGLMGSRAPVGRHATDSSGALFFALGEAAPECVHLATPGEPGPVVDAVAHDVSSVTHPGRVRGLVRLTGRAEVVPYPVCQELREHLGVSPQAPVARLVPDTVVLEWDVERRTSGVSIDARAYAHAEVDPLAGWQDEWIAHLDRHHREELRALVEDVVQPVGQVRPVLADASGLVLREYVGACRRDVRIAFPHAVTCACEAQAALADLVALRTR